MLQNIKVFAALVLHHYVLVVGLLLPILFMYQKLHKQKSLYENSMLSTYAKLTIAVLTSIIIVESTHAVWLGTESLYTAITAMLVEASVCQTKQIQVQ